MEMPAADTAEGGEPGDDRIRSLESEHAELTHSLLSLTTHFAQVQFRLKQIVAADPEDREQMLRSLEEVAFHGCPNVRTREESSTLLQLLSEKDYEERLREQKTRQQGLIQQLQKQLEELEQHSIDSQQRATELQTQFDPEVADRQRLLIEELKSRLNINIDFMNAMSVDEVRKTVDSAVHEVTRPARTKEQQIRMLSSQVEDLERYVEFLKEHSSHPVGNKQVVTKQPKGRASQTAGKSTRNSKVSKDGDRRERGHSCCVPDGQTTVPMSSNGESEDEIDDGLEDSDEENAALNKSERRKEFIAETKRTALSYAAAVGVRWLGGVLCGLQPETKGIKQARAERCVVLCQRTKRAVNNILTLVAAEANSSPEDDGHSLAAHSSSPELTRLARNSLGNVLLEVFHHGLVSPLVGTGLVPGWHALSCTVMPSEAVSAGVKPSEHVWQVFEQYYTLKRGREYNSTPARTLASAFQINLEGGVPATPRQILFDSMMNIQRTHESAYKSPNVKFRSLVCAGMNHGLLASWCSMIATAEELTRQYYEPWSCMNINASSIVADLQRLSQLRLQLSIAPPLASPGQENDDVDVISGPTN